MYSVSSEYASEIKNKVRNPSYIKINFTITDPEASADSDTSDNGEVYWSASEELITSSEDVETTYLTLEHNRGILSGNYSLPIPDGETQIYEGYVGNEISGSDGMWATSPIITIDFLTNSFEFSGFTITFDNILGDYPEEFTLNTYLLGSPVQSLTLNPTSYDFSIETAIHECDQIVITPTNSHIPYRRFRISDIILGIRRIFTEKNITSADWKREIDLINSKLPTHTFDFTIIDADREYDPENAEGIYAYIEAKQECEIKIGYELDDESIEWQPIGNYFTTGELKVNSEAVIPTVDFKTTSLIPFLTNIYTEGIYAPSGATLYDLAQSVLEFCNIPKDSSGNDRWSLDSSLSSYSTKIPLGKEKCNVLLQKIANAGMCILDFGRDGYITISPKNDTAQSFVYELGDMATPPKISKYPLLQGVDTVYNTVALETSGTIGTYDITGASSTTYELEYDSSTNIAAVAGSGLTIVGTPEYYSEMCRIVLTGTGTLTITGQTLLLTPVAVSVEFNVSGERCPISNELINSESHATSFGTWVGNYVNRRNEYEFEDRGFPEIDQGDSINIDTLYSEDTPVDLLFTEIKYNGSISGKTKVLQKVVV